MYLLTQVYRQNENNPSFLQIIAIARHRDHKEPNPYCYIDCDSNSDRGFIVSRYGNAKKSHEVTRDRQIPASKRKATEMLKNMPACAKVYRDMVKEAKV